MQIEQIEISNFKGIQEEKFAFTPEVNLIIGDNGTGKTSVLEALLRWEDSLQELEK